MFLAKTENVGKTNSPKNVPDAAPAPRFLQSRSDYSAYLATAILALTCLLTGLVAAPAGAQPQTITFQPSGVDFANPERGFFHFRTLTEPFNFAQVRADGHSLIYGRIPAQQFRGGPLSQQFLDQIQAGFDEARVQGIKVKPRVVYNDGPDDPLGGFDAPKSVILGHIQQLQGLLEANKDVIYVMDAGFIGHWGEWHSSTNGLDNNADRTEILAALLAALPADRMVGLRTPHYKREIFNGSPTSAAQKITASNAFDGSNLTRVGHLNDCFLSSPNDFGTYIYQGAGWPLSAELDYIGGESRYAPHGGETCALHDRNQGDNAIAEMEILHTDYLNISWNPQVIQRWINEGHFDEISKRLGYRFELQTAQLPLAVRPSGLLELRFDIDNVGFGELFNPRDVEVTLTNNATNVEQAAVLRVDPRFWSGGSSNQIEAWLSLPADLAEGVYTVGLRLPDNESSIRDDVRYAIQFANQGVWDSTTGINRLLADLAVSHAATGPVYVNIDTFEEIVDPSLLEATIDADFDRDGDVDEDDINALVENVAVGSGSLLYDLTRDGVVDVLDLARWLVDAGAANLPSENPYLLGDANLDGVVDGSDFIRWNSHKFTSDPRWTAGDFNADGVVDGLDFIVWNDHKFTSSVVLVPEPVKILLVGPIVILLARIRR